MKRLSFLTVLFYPILSFGVTQEDVVRSSLQNVPKVLEAVQKIEEQANKTQSALGAFDAKIKGDVDSRTTGFYSGDSYKVQAVKPLQFFNSKVYGGHRLSRGTFPDYEGKTVTLSEGETFIGFSVSFLRDSFIDINRHNLWLKQQNEVQAQINLDRVKINVQTMALQSYWTWLVKGYELKVYENILKLAQVRAKQISKRIRAGDLARIYEVENNQYIKKRQADVVRSRVDFQQASYFLSLFYRDFNGVPKTLSQKDLPDLKGVKLPLMTDQSRIYERAVSANLNLKTLNSKRKQAELDLRLGKNATLPKLDFNFEWNQDLGVPTEATTVTPATLIGDENRLTLNVEFPLQFRKGLGKIRAGKAKVSQIKFKEKWTREKLKVKVQSLMPVSYTHLTLPTIYSV